MSGPPEDPAPPAAAGRRRVARVADIPAWGLRFPHGDPALGEEGVLLRLVDGSVRAYSLECRHQPMPLDARAPGDLWDASGTMLQCSSHGALYRPEDGRCVAGPCVDAHLRSLDILVEDGVVFLLE